jgi:hypothetical protein
MQAEGSGLSRLQEKAIEALLTTKTRAEAAEVAGCSERSIYKWLADPVFTAELMKREGILRREVGRQLSQDANKALSLLKDFMDSERVDDRLRLRAADLWLDYLIKTEDYSSLEARIAAIEAAYQEAQ